MSAVLLVIASIRGSAAAADSPRSASRNNKLRGEASPVRSWPSTKVAPVSMAAPFLRRRRWLATSAPARRASSAVASWEPSSTTTTRSTPGRLCAAVTVVAIRSSSLQAGMTTAMRWRVTAAPAIGCPDIEGESKMRWGSAGGW